MFFKLLFPERAEPINPPFKNGDRVRLTWLPNPRNHPGTKSCYIGCEGIVEDYDPTGIDKGFMLNMGTSKLIVNQKYRLEVL